MVTNLLGCNLEEYMRIVGRQFSLKTVLMLADQMLTRIETFHELNYIHRDLKPENFMMDSGSVSKKLFIIDFGLAKEYKDVNGRHISCKEKKGLAGTLRYASINTHLGIEQSRRDDLEALAYILIYLMRGKLPWQDIKTASKEEMCHKIGEIKIKIPVEKLCEGLPKEFAAYLTHVKELEFDERPNYGYLKKLFRKLFLESGYEFDDRYDWNNNKKKREEANSNKSLTLKLTKIEENIPKLSPSKLQAGIEF